MTSIDSLLSTRTFLPISLPDRVNSKRLKFAWNNRPQSPFLYRTLIVSRRSISDSSESSSSRPSDKSRDAEEDFVTRVLKENPSQLEPRYLIGDKFYTSKQKEDLSKNSDVGVFEFLVKRLNLKSKSTNESNEDRNESEAVYLKDILREYRGKLYVPEQAFGTVLSEEKEFEKSFEELPKLSLEEFQKAMKSNKVKLLTSKETRGVSGETGYKNFIVDLKDIPGDKGLHRTKWAMRLDYNEAQIFFWRSKIPEALFLL